MLKSAQTIVKLFTTSNPTTGAAADASSLPTGKLYINGTANAAVVTITNITTGLYKASVTLPTLTAGDVVDIRVAATVATVAGEGVIFSGVADTKRVSELHDVDLTGVATETTLTLITKLLRNAHKVTPTTGTLYIYDGDDDQAAVLEEYELYDANGVRSSDNFTYMKRVTA